jgi:hypothetical protein
MMGRPKLLKQLDPPRDQLESKIAGAVYDERRDGVARRSGGPTPF